MNEVIPYKNIVNEQSLHKMLSANKMKQVLSEIGDQRLIKTASSGNDALINLFTIMLNTLNIKTGEKDIKELADRVSGSIEKEAAINKTSEEKKDEIKIVSKSVKESHFQVDISKDIIQKAGRKIYMISCYAKDAYLGRYLVKRNFFFTLDREKAANNAYNEIMIKVGDIKDRYYNEVIDSSGIFTQIKQTLDGVISELEIEEDSIGTNINRKPPS